MVLELDTERCASEEAVTEGGRHKAVCQDAGSGGGEFGGVPHRLWKGTSSSEDAGL